MAGVGASERRKPSFSAVESLPRPGQGPLDCEPLSSGRVIRFLLYIHSGQYSASQGPATSCCCLCVDLRRVRQVRVVAVKVGFPSIRGEALWMCLERMGLD